MDIFLSFFEKIKASPRKPWLFFLVFVIANAILAYSFLPLSLRVLVFVFGLLIPMAVMLRVQEKARTGEKPVFGEESFSTFPLWIWGLVLFLAFAARFSFLTSFFKEFPIYDEVFNAYYALQLDQKWTWYPFFFFSQLPPFYIWVLALLFKVFGFSLLVLWLVPAFLSFAVVGAGYFAARKFFSKTFSFLITGLMAISFWPVLIGRFSHQAGLLLFWEVLTFIVLGWYLKSARVSNAVIQLAVLGVCCGAGFYTYLAWPLVVVLVGGTVLTATLINHRNVRLQMMWFLVPMGITVLPLLAAAFQGGYGQYISAQFVLNHDKTDSTYGSMWDSSQPFYYLTVLFWKTWNQYYSYGPIFGGFLNPILGAAFFIGLVELWKFRAESMGRWIAAAFLILFIPILFTNVFNVLRLTPLIPFVILVTAAGIQVLVRASGGFSKAFWVALILLSCGLDLANLELTRSWTNYFYPGQKNQEEIQKYEALLGKSRQSGPGFIFLHFTTGGWDQSVEVMTHSFNAMENPGVSKANVTWAALLTTLSFKPYLNHELENLQWISPDGSKDTEALVFIPVTRRNEPFIAALSNAYDVSKKMNFLVHRHFMNGYSPEVVDLMLNRYSSFKGDRFLESFYWQELIEQYQRGKCYRQALDAVTKEMQRGFLTLDIQFLRATLLVRTHRYAEAKSIFLWLNKMHYTYGIPPEIFRLLDQYIKMSQVH